MPEFTKYPHLERLISDEVDGILDGHCHVFYKIDGTNASVWLDDDGRLSAGSRNRVLSVENDNAGFCAFAQKNEKLNDLLAGFPELIVYGEWLVPHSLTTYRNDAWRKFYIFDVFNHETKEFYEYDRYQDILDAYDLDYIPPLATIKNPSEDDLYRLLKNTGQFLVEDGKGDGEGIVIKNYGFVNKYGRTTWAKMVTNEFKEKNHKMMGAPELNATATYEEIFVRDFLTSAFIQKEKSKILVQKNLYDDEVNLETVQHLFQNKWIPELLGRVWYEFIQEELFDFLKKHKNPKINFRFLQQLVIKRVKEELGL